MAIYISSILLENKHYIVQSDPVFRVSKSIKFHYIQIKKRFHYAASTETLSQIA